VVGRLHRAAEGPGRAAKAPRHRLDAEPRRRLRAVGRRRLDRVGTYTIWVTIAAYTEETR
jgi:hypothetical protein